MSDQMNTIYTYLEANQDTYISKLSEWVAIKSISNDSARLEDTTNMVNTAGQLLHDLLGATVDIRANPANEGETLYPPILLGKLGEDPAKRTLLIYGHLDVMPADVNDGWVTPDPFVLTEVDGKLYGRGSTDDKGPILAWIAAIDAYKKNDMDIPVNIKFCLEAMEEAGGAGIEQLVNDEKDAFFSGVDFTCVSDNYWLGQTKPCITYGLRGIIYVHVNIKGANVDLHSGVYGGSVHEPMKDLMNIFGQLVDDTGHILITGVNDSVDELTAAEDESYNDIEFDIQEFKEYLGGYKLLHDEKKSLLQHRWRYPSLSIHGIEGAFSDEGSSTVIPSEVTGKFSIRLVPSQDPETIEQLVRAYINGLHSASSSGSDLSIDVTVSADAWVGDTTDPNYTAGKAAVSKVHKQAADLTREGGSIPVILTMEEATETSVMLLPIGASDDGAHGPNEKMNRVNFVNGMKVLGTYLDELNKIPANVNLSKKKKSKASLRNSIKQHKEMKKFCLH